jgi:beta-lactam-binding protein with PASTA domain
MSNPSYICLYCLEQKSAPGVCPQCGVDDRQIPESISAMPPGSMLNGRFLVGRLLGAGGFGNTYLALETTLGIKLAIKEYLPQGIASRRIGQSGVIVMNDETLEQYSSGLDKFLGEAKTLSRFNGHPGIVSIRDFFHENNTAYIVMEYIDGITLKQYLKQKGGRIPIAQALEIMMPVMDALREVHGAGILHRDISPDNIYITRDRKVKLLDFGAARHALGEASKSLSVILKPGYAPEEQYRTKGKQGPWTDVYAVAATLYRCISGQLPPDALDRFDEDTLEPLHKIVPDAPKEFSEVIQTALAVRSRDRYQSMVAFQQALQVDKWIRASERADERRSQINTKVSADIKVEASSVSGVLVSNQPVSQPSRREASAANPSQLDHQPTTRSNQRKRWLVYGVGICCIIIALIFVLWPDSTSDQVQNDSTDRPSETLDLTNPTESESQVSVPIVTNQSLAQAKQIIKDEGLQVGTISTSQTNEYPAGTVIDQTPQADVQVSKGSSVALVVSEQLPKVQVPDVTNRSKQEAEKLLLQVGLRASIVERVEREDVPAGTVVKQNPASGKMVAPEQTVLLTLSSEAKTVRVPDVRGDSVARAKQTLQANGLSVGTISKSTRDDIAEGTVISQTPTAGNEVKPGQSVKLTISSKPAAPVTTNCIDIGGLDGPRQNGWIYYERNDGIFKVRTNGCDNTKLDNRTGFIEGIEGNRLKVSSANGVFYVNIR